MIKTKIDFMSLLMNKEWISDLRDDGEEPCVTYEEGCRVAEEHAMMYCETSALTQEGVQDCFHQTVRT